MRDKALGELSYQNQVGFAYRYPDRHPVPVSADTGTL